MKEKYIRPEDIRSLLSLQFDEEAREHVEHKSQFYTEKIIKKVTPSIKSYEKKVDNLKEIVLSHQNELIEVSESIELQRRELETATGEAKDKIQMKITRIINIQNKG